MPRSKLLIVFRNGVQVPMEVESYNLQLTRHRDYPRVRSLSVVQSKMPTRLLFLDPTDIMLVLSEELPQ